MKANRQSGMNLIELTVFLLAVAGAFYGASFGETHFGVWGVVLGIPVGAGLGLLFAACVLVLLALVLKVTVGGSFFAPRKPKK